MLVMVFWKEIEKDTLSGIHLVCQHACSVGCAVLAAVEKTEQDCKRGGRGIWKNLFNLK